MEPKLVHARKAKLMMGMVNKTDKLDARDLNLLQRTGTLPTVWIPPLDARDKRELPRTRIVFSCQRTRLKNRIHSVIDKYGMQYEFKGMSDKIKLLKTLPGVGFILALEMSDVERFASKCSFASYSGTTPRVKQSGDKTKYDRLRSDTNWTQISKSLI